MTPGWFKIFAVNSQKPSDKMSTAMLTTNRAEISSSTDAAQGEYGGRNRRATAVLPASMLQPLDQFHSLGQEEYQELFHSVENKKQTCCLQIESAANRSRSAVLVFRGKVLGCIYGKQGMGHYLYNRAAYECTCKDLACADHSLTIYRLDEELAIASAALFHGKGLALPGEEDAGWLFAYAHDKLVQFNMPGCISVIGDSDASVCMVYIFGGKIVAIYSYSAGWMEATYAAAKHIIEQNPTVRLRASMLEATNTNEVMQLTFNLSGQPARSQSPIEVNTLTMIPAIADSRPLSSPSLLPKLRSFSSAIGSDEDLLKQRRNRAANNASLAAISLSGAQGQTAGTV